MSEEGQVFASGSNLSVALGVGDGFDKTQTPVHIEALQDLKVVQIDANFNSACVTEQGELFLWGRGVWGDQPFPQKILTVSNPVIDLSLGRDVSVAIDDQGLAWSWGANTNGQLGVGDQDARVHPFPILNLKGKVVKRANCGHNFVICLGNTIRKEIQHQNVTGQQQVSGAELKKKKVLKRKSKDGKKNRSTTRPQTASNYSKFTAEQSN